MGKIYGKQNGENKLIIDGDDIDQRLSALEANWDSISLTFYEDFSSNLTPKSGYTIIMSNALVSELKGGRFVNLRVQFSSSANLPPNSYHNLFSITGENFTPDNGGLVSCDYASAGLTPAFNVWLNPREQINSGKSKELYIMYIHVDK